jgi:polar amino acid transport system substrate-binding protein
MRKPMTLTVLAVPAVLAALLQSGAVAGAAEVTLYLMEVPPLTLNQPGRKGIAGDLTLEAIRRAGYTAKIVVVPNNRAMAMVQGAEARDTLIIPLARLKEREPHYHWIAPVARVNRAFFSLDRKVASFDEARASFRLVGVARGTAGVSILREHGFADSQIYEVNDTNVGARMLALRRFDAWYGPTRQFQQWLLEIDPAPPVQASAPLGTTLNYLACSKACDPQLSTRLADAVDQMNRDGSARAIEARYGRGD